MKAEVISMILFVAGLALGAASPLIRAIFIESLRHPLQKTRLEVGQERIKVGIA